MKRKFSPVALLVLILVITSIFVLVMWRHQRDTQSAEIKTPFSRLDQAHELTVQLEKSGLNLGKAPLVLGDTIEASVSGFRVLFTSSTDFQTQIRTLQVVLGRLKMDSKITREIDLRFNKVIIR